MKLQQKRTSSMTSLGLIIRVAPLALAADLPAVGAAIIVLPEAALAVEGAALAAALVPVKNAAPTGMTHFRLPGCCLSLNPTVFGFGVNLLTVNAFPPFFFPLSPLLLLSCLFPSELDAELKNIMKCMINDGFQCEKGNEHVHTLRKELHQQESPFLQELLVQTLASWVQISVEQTRS